MPLALTQINFFLALGTITLQVLIVWGIVSLLIGAYRKSPFLGILERYALWTAFVFSLFGVLLTLFYSEVIGYPPCGLCWLQRVFLYPLPVILGIALWRRDRHIADYVIGLSFFGALAALYQYYLQMGGVYGLLCLSAADITADCARRYVFEFGYITLPLMSFTLFAFLIVLFLLYKKVRGNLYG